MPTFQSRSWVWTLNNYSCEELGILVELAESEPTDQLRAFGFQAEVGEQGTPHLQGYIYFIALKSLAAVKAFLSIDRLHLESARGTFAQVRAYCDKDESRDPDGVSVHWGDVAQGGRSDLARLKEFVDGLGADATFELVRDEFFSLAVRYGESIKAYIDSVRDQSFKSGVTELRPWQSKLKEDLAGAADDRKVIWYIDTEGGRGKTTFSRYAVEHLAAFYCRSGKVSDVLYAYKGQSIVLVDLSRECRDHFQYSILEQLKDGMIFSGKYQSTSRLFQSPHVVVFANFAPDTSKLSLDRWDIRYLDTV